MSSPPKNTSTQLRSLRKTARGLDVSVSTVRRLCASGALPAIKIGGQLRIADSDYEKFVSSADSAWVPADDDDCA